MSLLFNVAVVHYGYCFTSRRKNHRINADCVNGLCVSQIQVVEIQRQLSVIRDRFIYYQPGCDD